MPHLLLIPALLLLGPTSSDSPGAPKPGVEDERESLESLLERARERQAAIQAKLTPEVGRLVKLAESLAPDAPTERRDKVVESIVELGAEATPLLVGFLENLQVSEGAAQRAKMVQLALEQMPTAAVTNDLLGIAKGGTESGRVRAIEVLARSSERARVSPELVMLYETREGRTRYAALAALGRLGGESNLAYVVSALDAEDPIAVSTALSTLAEVGHEEAADRVRQLLDTDGANLLANSLLRYYQVCSDSLDDDVMTGLLRLAARSGTPPSDKARLLAELPEFDLRWEREWEGALAPLVDGGDSTLREEALVCLARLGSAGAKRDLVERYNDLIDNDEGWYQAWKQRADMYLRLDEFRLAVRDYKKAIDLHRGPTATQRELWIGLARAHALSGNLRHAHEALEDARLPPRTLAELAKDPDFAPMVEHSTYGKLFQ